MTNEELLASLSGSLRQHMERIMPRLDQFEQKLQDTEMNVLVFGPGKKKGHRLYQKRERIRAELNKVPGVRAHFPEDKEYAAAFRQKFGLAEGDPTALELAQANAADVIIALEPGPGVEDEVAVMSMRRELAMKIYNLLPKEYVPTASKSFSGILRGRLTKYYYSQAEVKRCDLATRICPEHVKGEQIRKAVGGL